MISTLTNLFYLRLRKLGIMELRPLRSWQGQKLLLCLSITLMLGSAISQGAKAQSGSPFAIPTPNAASLGEYGQVPVSLFNGLPSILVPLYTFKYRDIAIPIALNYHAGGNRPENYPGWVGLGWNLDAGGAVTRIMNGRPDEITADDMNQQNGAGPQYPLTREYGYFFRSNDFARNDWATQSYMTGFLESAPAQGWLSSPIQLGPFDGEPDEFMFNAGDLSGSFFLYRDANTDLKVKVKSKSGEHLLVVPTLSTAPVDVEVFKELTTRKPSVHMRRTFTGFTLTRADGTKYYFGGNLNATDLNTTPGSTTFVVTIATSWFLTKITSPKGDIVNLEYKKQGDVFIKNTSRTRSFLYISGSNTPTTSDVQSTYSLQHPSYLSKITAPDGSEVSFLSDRAYQLAYDFTSPLNYQTQFAPLDFASRWNPNFLLFNYLLKLNQIKVNGIRNITFNYVNTTSQRLRLGNVEVTNPTDAASFKYQFAYNPTFLPAYNSKRTDNWGYYNGRNYGNVMNSSTLATFNKEMYDFRSPDAALMKAEILETITYPTGGHTTFEFEPHDYSKVAQQYPFDLVNETGTAGGLRIRRITSRTSTADARPQVWEYLYKNTDNSSSGVLSGKPLYGVKGDQYVDYSYSQWRGLVHHSASASYQQNYVILSENAQNPLSHTNGNHVTYSRVTEKRTGQGYTVYRYTNTDTRDASGSLLYRDQDPEGALSTINEKLIDNPFTSRALERGLLLVTEVYDEGNTLLKKVENQYNDDPNRYDNYVKSISSTIIFGLSYPFIRSAANRIYTFYPCLKRQIVTQFPSGTGPVVSTTNYDYNTYNLLSEENTTDSGGNSLRTVYRYPTDVSYSGPTPYVNTTRGLILSVSQNIISTPVETVRYRNGAVIDGKVMLPGDNGAGMVAPYQVYEFETTEPVADAQYTRLFFPAGTDNFIFPRFDLKYKLRQTFNTYDANGNILNEVKAGQGPLSYIWDYGKTLPVAMAQNAALNRIAYAGFESDLCGRFIGNTYETFDANNWDYDPRPGLTTHLQPSGGFTGHGCYRLDGGWSVGRSNLPVGDYEVSFWAKGGKSNIYVWGGQVLSESEGPPNANAQDYRLVRYRLRLNATGNIAFDAYGRHVDVDDVRLFPLGAQMATYTHTPQVGVTSTSDANNQPTQYDYDGLQRLRLVKDNRGNVVKHLQYHYQQ